MNDIEIQLKEAQEAVRTVIGEEIKRLGQMEPCGLYEPMEYILDLGGKRLRPMLAFLSYKTFNAAGELAEIAPLMRAVEVFHNFSLLHDDLMDDAPVRRGKPTAYYKWGANTAVLSGDGMLIESYKALEGIRPELLGRLLPIFNDMAMGVCEGQQYDMEFEKKNLGDVSIQNYLNMILLKTSYLFRGSMSMGALIGGAPDDDVAHIAKAADLMGLAFQIMDDYLDLFSEPEFGKRRGGDVIEGKQTWLLLTAHMRSSRELSAALGIQDEQLRIDEVRKVYESHNVPSDALTEVRRMTDEALRELQYLSMPSDALQALFRSLTARVV